MQIPYEQFFDAVGVACAYRPLIRKLLTETSSHAAAFLAGVPSPVFVCSLGVVADRSSVFLRSAKSFVNEVGVFAEIAKFGRSSTFKMDSREGMRKFVFISFI